ncbi:SEC14-like protein 1 isoform X1, partial [Tachysurus ichikawai]
RRESSSTMVQQYQSPVRVYKHPFELVMAVSTRLSLYFNLTLGFCTLRQTPRVLAPHHGVRRQRGRFSDALF